MQGAQVRFQVGELRSCMPHGVAKMNRDLIEKKKKDFFYRDGSKHNSYQGLGEGMERQYLRETVSVWGQ